MPSQKALIKNLEIRVFGAPKNSSTVVVLVYHSSFKSYGIRICSDSCSKYETCVGRMKETPHNFRIVVFTVQNTCMPHCLRILVTAEKSTINSWRMSKLLRFVLLKHLNFVIIFFRASTLDLSLCLFGFPKFISNGFICCESIGLL